MAVGPKLHPNAHLCRFFFIHRANLGSPQIRSNCCQNVRLFERVGSRSALVSTQARRGSLSTFIGIQPGFTTTCKPELLNACKRTVKCTHTITLTRPRICFRSFIASQGPTRPKFKTKNHISRVTM